MCFDKALMGLSLRTKLLVDKQVKRSLNSTRLRVSIKLIGLGLRTGLLADKEVKRSLNSTRLCVSTKLIGLSLKTRLSDDQQVNWPSKRIPNTQKTKEYHRCFYNFAGIGACINEPLKRTAGP